VHAGGVRPAEDSFTRRRTTRNRGKLRINAADPPVASPMAIIKALKADVEGVGIDAAPPLLERCSAGSRESRNREGAAIDASTAREAATLLVAELRERRVL